MKTIKVIITGATGMVGEGVMFECIQNEKVSEILLVNRKPTHISNPKVKELIVSDFMKLADFADNLIGYDACFFCAGISSVGVKEEEYTKSTYDTTLQFAKALFAINPQMVFTYVSGQSTDSTEKGRLMWARVKGKTENDLAKLGFKGQYNFRPGFMKHFAEQKNVKSIFKFVAAIFPVLFPSSSLTLAQVGDAMINVTIAGFPKNVLEIKDIKEAAEML